MPHHQENKTVYYCMWCSAMAVVVLAVCTVEINQQDATNLMFIMKLLSQHVSGHHYAPSSGEQDRVLLHMVFCTGCVGRGCVQLGRKL